MNSLGRLYLLPNLLDENSSTKMFLPEGVSEIVSSLQGLIAESESSARAFLRRFLPREKWSILPLRILNEHTKQTELKDLLDPMIRGETWGLISDAGLPCIADPGSSLVALARGFFVKVIAIPGPSSIILALQLSGFDSQRFSFHGYLPREEESLKQCILQLEECSKREKAVQLCIEAPYRSMKLAKILIETLSLSTQLSIALSLCSQKERVHTASIKYWKEHPWVIEKEPAIFLIYTLCI